MRPWPMRLVDQLDRSAYPLGMPRQARAPEEHSPRTKLVFTALDLLETRREPERSVASPMTLTSVDCDPTI